MRTAALAGFLLLAACGGEGEGGEPGAAGSLSPDPGPAITSGPLEISRAVVPEPPAGDRAALYVTVRDRGDTGDALLGLASPAAARAGLHRTQTRGSMARMHAVDSVPVPAGGEARLAPGGFHGMLEGLASPLREGDTLPVRLRFRHAGDVEVRARVVSYDALDALYPPSGAADASEHPIHGGTGPS